MLCQMSVMLWAPFTIALPEKAGNTRWHMPSCSPQLACAHASTHICRCTTAPNRVHTVTQHEYLKHTHHTHSSLTHSIAHICTCAYAYTHAGDTPYTHIYKHIPTCACTQRPLHTQRERKRDSQDREIVILHRNAVGCVQLGKQQRAC